MVTPEYVEDEMLRSGSSDSTARVYIPSASDDVAVHPLHAMFTSSVGADPLSPIVVLHTNVSPALKKPLASRSMYARMIDGLSSTDGSSITPESVSVLVAVVLPLIGLVISGTSAGVLSTLRSFADPA